MSESNIVLETVVREIDAGRRVALGVVVTTRGSTPQVPGAMICVDEAAQITGTIGGGCVEAEVRRRAHELLSSGGLPDQVPMATGTLSSAPPPIEHAGAGGSETPTGHLVTLDLDNDFGLDDGLICGGHMDVAITVYSEPDRVRSLREALGQLQAGSPATVPIRVSTSKGPVEYRLNLESAPKLVIAGGGHVGQALAKAAVPLGFQITVIDDRSEFAGPERFPPPIEPVTGNIEETLASWPIDANTYVVIVTRGHKNDERALGAVIDSPAKYLGMIGSRRKIKVIFDDLKHEGVSPEKLDRVHAPIGLDIKAVTVDEIAVSIAAELISIRRAAYRPIVEGPLPG